MAKREAMIKESDMSDDSASPASSEVHITGLTVIKDGTGQRSKPFSVVVTGLREDQADAVIAAVGAALARDPWDKLDTLRVEQR